MSFEQRKPLLVQLIRRYRDEASAQGRNIPPWRPILDCTTFHSFIFVVSEDYRTAEVESIFLKSNFPLLAEAYRVSQGWPADQRTAPSLQLKPWTKLPTELLRDTFEWVNEINKQDGLGRNMIPLLIVSPQWCQICLGTSSLWGLLDLFQSEAYRSAVNSLCRNPDVVRYDVSDFLDNRKIDEEIEILASGTQFSSISLTLRRRQWPSFEQFVASHRTTLHSTRLSIEDDSSTGPAATQTQPIPPLSDIPNVTQLYVTNLRISSYQQLQPGLGENLLDLSIVLARLMRMDISVAIKVLGQCRNLISFASPSDPSAPLAFIPCRDIQSVRTDGIIVCRPALKRFRWGAIERNDVDLLLSRAETPNLQDMQFIMLPERITDPRLARRPAMRVPDSLQSWTKTATHVKITTSQSIMGIKYGLPDNYTHQFHALHPWGLGPINKREFDQWPSSTFTSIQSCFERVEFLDIDGIGPDEDQWFSLLSTSGPMSRLAATGPNVIELMQCILKHPYLAAKITCLRIWLLLPRSNKSSVTNLKRSFLNLQSTLIKLYKNEGRSADSLAFRIQDEMAKFGDKSKASEIQTSRMFVDRNRDENGNAEPTDWFITCHLPYRFPQHEHRRQTFAAT
ncbi:hypothetical protein SISNIDRAFT_465272 [Sistotremastrum niveocremeum HHB9708]|uniref:Uncharacterized protein n=1 Tax=Sistotremastrum niveocremeum HHB9708 TaxID=1314777 RepID=A0A164VP59_9AGAM|nr:hypothetical protein SISNIDRAFT_465272 [Sistotremastrum niveocremeum HHB9708]